MGQDRVEDVAVAVSSNIFYSCSVTSYITNNTVLITPDFSTNVSNELVAVERFAGRHNGAADKRGNRL